jgi:hypothetical protein
MKQLQHFDIITAWLIRPDSFNGDKVMFYSIRAIKAANEAAGQFFFSPSSMAFFQSRVSHKLHGPYFVTSERPRWDHNASRRYTIRKVEDNGAVDTIGEFGAFASSREAHREAARLWEADCRQSAHVGYPVEAVRSMAAMG